MTRAQYSQTPRGSRNRAKQAPRPATPSVPKDLETKENPMTGQTLNVETKKDDDSDQSQSNEKTDTSNKKKISEDDSDGPSATQGDVDPGFHYDGPRRRIIHPGAPLTVRGVDEYNTIIVQDEVWQQFRLPGTRGLGLQLIYFQGQVLARGTLEEQGVRVDDLG